MEPIHSNKWGDRVDDEKASSEDNFDDELQVAVASQSCANVVGNSDQHDMVTSSATKSLKQHEVPSDQTTMVVYEKGQENLDSSELFD